jgi:hypothetical protein
MLCQILKKERSSMKSFALFMGTVLLCGGLAGCGTTNAAAANAKAPERPKKEVDIPALLGKSRKEINTTLGKPSSTGAYSDTWDFEAGGLTVHYDTKKTDEVSFYAYEAKMISIGGQVAHGFAKYEPIGDLTGVDVTGKTPTSSDTGDTGYTRFENMQVNGQNVHEVSFSKVSGKYTGMTARPKKNF